MNASEIELKTLRADLAKAGDIVDALRAENLQLARTVAELRRQRDTQWKGESALAGELDGLRTTVQMLRDQVKMLEQELTR